MSVASTVEFWQRQIAEHVYLLTQLIDAEPSLLKQSNELFDAWNCRKLCEKHCELSNATYSLLICVENRLHDSLPLIEGNVVIRPPIAPNISSAISAEDLHALVKHMLVEQAYFNNLIAGKETIQRELRFWIQESAEHLELLSHLIPGADLAKEAAAALRSYHAASLNQIVPNEEELLLEVEQITLGLKQLTNVPLQQVIIDHEARESAMGRLRVRALLDYLARTSPTI